MVRELSSRTLALFDAICKPLADGRPLEVTDKVRRLRAGRHCAVALARGLIVLPVSGGTLQHDRRHRDIACTEQQSEQRYGEQVDDPYRPVGKR